MRTLLFACCLLAPVAAGANETETTVAQKEGWIAYEAALAPLISRANARCASAVVGYYDKATYRTFDPLKDRTQAACQAAVGAVEALCASEAGKAAVRGLKAIACGFSTEGTGVAVSEGVLRIRIDPARSAITGREPGSYSWISALKERL